MTPFCQENELWDKESNHSVGSWVPPPKAKDGFDSRTVSLYGRETYYDPPQVPYSRSFSPAPSYGAGSPGARQQSSYDPFGRGSQSRPVTNYLGEVGGGLMGSPEYLGSPTGAPTDAELERAVQDILRDVDLTVSSKRGIRNKLEEIFGMDLASRKAFINAAIDRSLASQP